MSRRIEIEITSLNGDVATWRAAGAKLPKGVLNSSLVPGGPVVGNVYRADVEQYMEGIEILSVMAPKTASPVDPRNERIELIPTTKWSRRRRDLRPEGSRRFARDGRQHRDGGPGRRETVLDGANSRPVATKDAPVAAKTPRSPRSGRPARNPARDSPRRPERTNRPPRIPSSERTRPTSPRASGRFERRVRSSRARRSARSAPSVPCSPP